MKNPLIPNNATVCSKWLCELLGVPCFNGNTALIVKEYVAILGRFIPFLEGAIQKSRKDI